MLIVLQQDFVLTVVLAFGFTYYHTYVNIFFYSDEIYIVVNLFNV